MFKFLKFLIALVAIAGLVYFAYFVKLGEMTLWEHLVGISETEEAKGLKKELGDKADEIKEDVAKKVPGIAGDTEVEPKEDDKATTVPPKGVDVDKVDSKDATPLSDLTDEDRQKLIDLLKKKGE